MYTCRSWHHSFMGHMYLKLYHMMTMTNLAVVIRNARVTCFDGLQSVEYYCNVVGFPIAAVNDTSFHLGPLIPVNDLQIRVLHGRPTQTCQNRSKHTSNASMTQHISRSHPRVLMNTRTEERVQPHAFECDWRLGPAIHSHGSSYYSRVRSRQRRVRPHVSRAG